MNKYFLPYCLLLMLAFCSTSVTAQRLAVKTNLLYDATLTPNIGAELGIGKKSTVQVVYGFNPWEFSDGKQFKHWQLMPEYRWWPCSKFNGHFFGVHAMGGQFNVAKIDATLPFYGWPSDLDETRYEGWNVGGGFTYGYQWILGKHWNFEASVGVGYDYIKYKQYPCEDCGSLIREGHKNYFGFTKAVLSILYIF
ncbi:MAG: DUF3575 domain-containing protein [Bacteroidales bacterium]|nr:DUF3575 domain-containing protein [Bacteroidales bacterium]